MLLELFELPYVVFKMVTIHLVMIVLRILTLTKNSSQCLHQVKRPSTLYEIFQIHTDNTEMKRSEKCLKDVDKDVDNQVIQSGVEGSEKSFVD